MGVFIIVDAVVVGIVLILCLSMIAPFLGIRLIGIVDINEEIPGGIILIAVFIASLPFVGVPVDVFRLLNA